MSMRQKRSAPFSRRIQMEFSTGGLPVRNATVEDKIFSLFQPDVLVPSQYLATTKSKTYYEPEKKLMLAVLEDALWCFQNGLFSRDNKRKQALYSEAEEWMMEENGEGLFSFDEICELLNLEPRYLRKRLLRWKQETLRGRAEAHRQGRDKNRQTPARSGEKSRRYMSAAGF